MSVIYSDKLTRNDLLAVAAQMPVELYGTNLGNLEEFADNEGEHVKRGRRVSVRLRPVNSEAGERWRKVKDNPFTGNRRRVHAVSWQGYYVFWAALFELDPDMKVKSMVANWRNREHFYHTVDDTGFTNQGSQMFPEYAHYQCHEDDHITGAECRRIGKEIADQVAPRFGEHWGLHCRVRAT